jgi:ribosomal protein S10
MRSHSIFQEQKLIVLAPLTFYNYDVKTEQIAEDMKPAETSSYEPSKNFAAKPQISYATHKDDKKNLPNFFGSSPSINPLESSVAPNLTFRKKDPLSFFHFMQPSPLSSKESKNSLNNQIIQNVNSTPRAKISCGMQSTGPCKVTQNLLVYTPRPCYRRHKLRQGNREKLCIRREAGKVPLYMPFFTELVELQKCEINKPTVQVVLAFTSFEKKDLDWAFHLFQSYLTNITNRLITYNCFEKSVSLYSKEVKQRAQLLYGAPLNVRKAESRLRQEKSLIERITAVAGIARAVRTLNEPLRATAIPLSTQLYTVIRSPHVFKKTREQFATTQYKRVIKLSFRSHAALRLFIDSFLLLKLPVEVKLVIRDL